MKKIVDQKIETDETGHCWLTTKHDDGSVSSEPVTSEFAAQWQAEHGGM